MSLRYQKSINDISKHGMSTRRLSTSVRTQVGDETSKNIDLVVEPVRIDRDQQLKKQSEMFRISKIKRAKYINLYIDEEKDDFFLGCTFEDDLDCIGTREMLHQQHISIAPPPGKYRPKWEKIKPKNPTVVEWHWPFKGNQLESKKNVKSKTPRKPLFEKFDRNNNTEKFVKTQPNFINLATSSRTITKTENDFGSDTDRTYKTGHNMNYYANNTSSEKFYKGFVDLNRQLPRDRHDYIESHKNKPHEKRFFVIPDKSKVQKKTFKNIIMKKMLKRDFDQLKNKVKTGNLDYNPNYNFLKEKSTRGPQFKHYLKTNREIPNSNSSYGIKINKMLRMSQHFNSEEKIGNETVSFKKMIGRQELKGFFNKTTNNFYQGPPAKYPIEPVSAYTRRSPYNLLDVDSIIQNNLEKLSQN